MNFSIHALRCGTNLARRSFTLLLPASLSGAVLLAGGLGAMAQTSERIPASEYAITARTAHSRTWTRVIWETDPQGLSVPRTNSYIELGTGLCRPSLIAKGEFLDATTKVEAYPGGAASLETAWQGIFAKNLATPGAIHVKTPDGKEMRSHLLGIGYWDPVSQKSVMIAEVKDCEGVISGNSVIYEDATTDISCTIRYTATLAGLEQDIVILSPKDLPLPEDWGMSSETTKLQAFTEFIDFPEPAVVSTARGVSAPAEGSQDLDFGDMKITQGKAFYLGDGPDSQGIPVEKRWQSIENRQVLIEEIPVPAFEAELSKLPHHEGASLRQSPGKTAHLASTQLRLPAPRTRGTAEAEPMLVASVPPQLTGMVLDYVLQSVSATNYVFTNDTTFYISAPVNLAGSNVALGGCVIKLPASASAGITASNLAFVTRTYRPVVVTASDDNAHGETISDSTGNPGTKFYGKIALDLSGSTTAPVLDRVKFCYLSNAVAGSSIQLLNSQVLNCKTVFASGSTTPWLRNVLLYRVGTVLANSAAGTVRGVNVTGHFCTNFVANTTGAIYLTNSLLANVGSWQCTTTVTNATTVLASDSGVFQSVGGGNHYLAGTSPYRNTGTTNLDTGLLNILRTLTTYPPLVYSNVTFTTDATLYPQAQRDTDAIDQGFHFDVIDHAFGGTVANANLTFAPGTACAWFRTTSGWTHAGHGIKAGDQKRIIFDGRVEAPTYWVRYNTVQEAVNGIWAGGYGPGGITSWSASLALAPEIHARFLVASVLGSEGGSGNHFRDDGGWLTVRANDCEFLGGALGGYISSEYLTNCLFERTSVWVDGGQLDTVYALRNCTFIGGTLSINRYANPTLVSVRDSVFDGTKFLAADQYANNATNTSYDYNAFLTGQSRTAPTGTNDLLVTGTFNWRASWLGSYYVTNNSPLMDRGSLNNAALAGLYHYTTITNQTKEMNTRIDLGRHYVAVDANGKAIDSDGDGAPDYWEDRNGNGIPDSGETLTASKSDMGLKVLITRPKTGSLIP
jgi:hypothetical protein